MEKKDKKNGKRFCFRWSQNYFLSRVPGRGKSLIIKCETTSPSLKRTQIKGNPGLRFSFSGSGVRLWQRK